MQRTLGNLFKGTTLLVLLWGGLATAERVYWVKSSTYPTVLSRSVTVTEEMGTSDRGYAGLCLGTYATLEDKSNGHFVRCGFAWMPGSVYLIENYDQLSDWMWEEVKAGR